MKNIKKTTLCTFLVCSSVLGATTMSSSQVFATSTSVHTTSATKNATTFTYKELVYEIMTPDTGSGGSVKVSGVDTAIANMVIPSTVTDGSASYTVVEVGDAAFTGVSGIQSITMPDTITTLGMGAFANCVDLTDIKLSNGLQELPEDVLSQNPNLSSIYIPDSVIHIKGSAFDNDTGLKKISLPETITMIDADAFLQVDTVFEVRSSLVMSVQQRSAMEAILTNNTGLVAFSFLYGGISSIQAIGSVKTLEKGKSAELEATSTANASWVSTDMDWQIQGATSSQTTLQPSNATSDKKRLQIGADETASNLRIKVTSKFDVSKSSTIIIAVTNPHVQPTLSGIKNETITMGTAFDPMAGVSAYDDAHNDISAKIKVSGTVDTNKAGVYTLTYSVSDGFGLTTSAIRNITVQKAPVVPVAPTFSGIKNETITMGTAFDPMKGVQAFDDAHNDITTKIKVSGSVDTSKVGVYTLTYSVMDGNAMTSIATRIITVQKAPVVPAAPTFRGIKNETITIGTTFDPMAGITAFDATGKDITKNITLTGSVDTNKEGVYTLCYLVKDANGKQTSLTRSITVVAKATAKQTGTKEATTTSTQSSSAVKHSINTGDSHTSLLLMAYFLSAITAFMIMAVSYVCRRKV